MLFDDYRCVKNYQKGSRKSDKYSKEDIIDRTGYVPLDLQYYRMVEAGINLTRSIDSQYNYDWQSLEEAYNNNTLDVNNVAEGRLLKRFNDISVLHEEGVRLMDKYIKAKNDHEKISTLREKYLKDLEVEQIRKDAINDYIAQKREIKE